MGWLRSGCRTVHGSGCRHSSLWVSTTRPFIHPADSFRSTRRRCVRWLGWDGSIPPGPSRILPSATTSATCWSLVPVQRVCRRPLQPRSKGCECYWWKNKAQLGGTLCFQLAGEPEARALRRRLLDRARSLPTLEIRTSTVAAGYYADHWVALIDAVRLTKLRARSVVVATGCHEQPAVFRNNDLPGVMLASAAQRLVHQFAVRPCRAAVVLAANSEGYRAALDLVEAGTKVAVIADLRPDGERSPLGRRLNSQVCGFAEDAVFMKRFQGEETEPSRQLFCVPWPRREHSIIRDSSQVACDGIG